jgi:outer membrane protein TolC
MQERVGFVKRLHQAGAATQTDVLNAQYEALEAKARLEEELGN